MTTRTLHSGEPVTAPSHPPFKPGRRRVGPLRLLWAGQTVSLLGDQMTMLALPLAALAVGASPAQVAVLVGATHAPFLLFGLPAGVWVARFGLRRSMLFADVVRACALISVPIAAWVGTVTYVQLLLAAGAMGCGSVIFLVAYQSLTPLLVDDPGSLRSANKRLTASEALALVGGPALAGLLIGAVGAMRTLAIDAMSYLVSVGTLAALDAPTDGPRKPLPGTKLRTEVRAGLRYVQRSPELRAVMWSSVVFNFGMAGYEALLVVFAVSHLGLSPAVLGLAVGIGGAGVPIGLLLSGPVERRTGTGGVLIISGALSAAGLLIAASAGGEFSAVTIAAGTFVTAVGGGAWGLTALTTRQILSRPDMRSMTTAVHRWATYGVMPLGALGGGLCASLLGPRPAILLVATLAQFTVLPLLRSPLRTLRTLTSSDLAGSRDAA